MSCSDGRAGPRGRLWYQPTSDSPRMNRFWQICRRRRATDAKPASSHLLRVGPLCSTSSSTAEAVSLSASLVRQGKALRTVSTESSRPQTALSTRLCSECSQGQGSETALTLRVGVPPASEVAHHLAAGQVAVEVLKRVQKEVDEGRQSELTN